MCFLFVFETPLKDFPFHSPIILSLCFRYLKACIKGSCIYLPSQLLFQTSHETLKFQEILADLNFKSFPFHVYHGATPQSHWTEQTVKKLNLQGNMAVDKSANIKT